MAPDQCLAWDGSRFVPVPIWRPILGEGVRMTPGAVPAALVTPRAVRAYESAMTVNPWTRAFLCAGFEYFGYRAGMFEKDYLEIAQQSPAWAAGLAPQIRPYAGVGRCYYIDYFEEGFVIVRFDARRDPLATLYHELFHSISANIPAALYDCLVTYGDRLRLANRDRLHPDHYPGSWFASGEEAETTAFERFARGRPPAFGQELPRPVRIVFERVLQGEFAPHREAMREPRRARLERVGKEGEDARPERKKSPVMRLLSRLAY